MQALKLLIVLALMVATAWAKSGSITISNGGRYVASFSVSFTLNGERITEKSPDFSPGVAEMIYIPDSATDIEVKPEVVWVTTSKNTIFTQHYDTPVHKCFKVGGTNLNPSSEEEKCPST